MSENVLDPFHGFLDKDKVKVNLSVMNKLERLNNVVEKLGGERIRSRNPSAGSTTSIVSNSSSRRPPNRFLKRSESLPSPVRAVALLPKKPPVVAYTSNKPRSLECSAVEGKTVPSKKSPLPSENDHCSVGSQPRFEETNGIDSPGKNNAIISAGLRSPCETKNANGDSPKRVNKFLKSSTFKSNGMPSLNKKSAQVDSATKVETSAKSIVDNSSSFVEKGKQYRRTDICPREKVDLIKNVESKKEIGKETLDGTSKPENEVLVETGPSSTVYSGNKIGRKDASSSDMKAEKSETKSSAKADHLNKFNQNMKKPSPAKRSFSVSELSFLNSQPTRSKRTIVPNKRFFPDESESKASKHVASTSQKSPAKVTARNSVPAVNSVVDVKPLNVKAKRRSWSGDTPKKRKPSIDVTPIKNTLSVTKKGDSTIKPGISPLKGEEFGRPRRTIIPNRKFFSDEEMGKDLLPKKSTEPVEPPRKRRKSEKGKSAQNNREKVELVENTSLSSTCDESIKQTSQKCSDETKVTTGATSNTVFATKTKVASPAKTKQVKPIENGNPNANTALNGDSAKFKESKKEPEKPPPVVDEVSLDDTELKLCEGNSLFLGACLLKKKDLARTIGESNVVSTGIICCGVCSRPKKYRFFNQKRKQGSFLCSECGDKIDEIFQSALNAKPFSSIVGPPVCEGSCHLTFAPLEQFCQACFAKRCLQNLPMKDDIYFKIWRSIPPMSRGCLPIAPKVNQASPNVGKVILIDDGGNISNVAKVENNGPAAVSNHDNHVKEIAGLLNSKESVKIENGIDDLNSARITTFTHHRNESTSNNCENTIPIQSNCDESVTKSTELISTNETTKPNGVTHEEILLGRQIGQERVKALVDPILRPDADDIEFYGFPVIVSGSAYPRKPLCFLCGSAGIEQLIFCSVCCEPYHPYCAGDELLLDTYVLLCKSSKKASPLFSENPLGVAADTGENLQKLSNSQDVSKIVLKWNCRRCISCKTCGESFGHHQEFIRCNRCLNPFHLESCIDKPILAKFKDRSKLRKAWRCETCLNCKSCGKKIESNQRLRTIQQIAAAVDTSSDEDDIIDDDKELEDNVSNPSCNLLLCLECFKQRKKGSYCPLCDVSYDDNDWDSKMMECSKCSRWIHATCEKLSDEQYHILGSLPEYIEYVCRLCHCHASLGAPIWYDAVQSMLNKECSSALRLFEQKVLGGQIRKRASVDKKPSFVCNLFGEANLNSNSENLDEDGVEQMDEGVLTTTPKREIPDNITPPRRRNRTMSGKQMMKCRVRLRDFVKYPQSIEENWHALKILDVEILNKDYSIHPKAESPIMPSTPIHSTPMRYFTPKRNVIAITSTLRDSLGSVKSINVFRGIMMKEIFRLSETVEEKNALINQADEAIKETFPWFEPKTADSSENLLFSTDAINRVESDDIENCSSTTNEKVLVDPFKEVYWDVTDFFDNRCCVLCGEMGDFPSDTIGRLLWCGVNEWIHCNCAIWSSEVYELETGALQQVGGALNRGRATKCKLCNRKGATVSCCLSTCKNSYHFLCATEANCFLLEDKTMFCSHHTLSEDKKLTVQDDMKVGRKVFVDLDWIQKRGIKACSDDLKVFVGSVKVDSLGSIVPISVINKDWLGDSSTILIPTKFKAQRLFWSCDEPWMKESYLFQTDIVCHGGHKKTHDVGVNLVIDHSKSVASVSNGLDNIKKFHQWLKVAPKYIDQDFVDWLIPCSEEFIEVEDEYESDQSQNLFSSFPLPSSNRKSSPSSISSADSSKHNVKQSRTYNFRSLPGRIGPSSHEGVTDGYASSNDSVPRVDIPKSSPKNRSPKRRRSSCKSGRIFRRTRSRMTPTKKYDSPRRKSMRNLIMKEVVLQETKQPVVGMEEESDHDSGINDNASSTAGSYDGDRFRCRINLLTKFNESMDSEGSQIDEAFVSDSASMYSINIAPPLESPDELKESFVNDLPEEGHQDIENGQVYQASLEIFVKRNRNIFYQSKDICSAWTFIFEEVSKRRFENGMTPLVHPAFQGTKMDNSLRMLGFSQRTVQYLLEQLPSVKQAADRHKFSFGRRPYLNPTDLDYPVPANSTGSARSEGFTGRKPFDMFGWLASRYRQVPTASGIGDEPTRSQGLPLAMRFRDLGARAKRRFVVLHSEIHGRGLFTRCDVDKSDMLIEYAGEVIRPSLSDPRERYYDSRGIGCYMFRVKTQVIDATLKGNAARFINHSCEPNCEAKTVRILGKDRILIFALRKIFKGEELTYDYKFEREEDKIPCTCGAVKCRRFMN